MAFKTLKTDELLTDALVVDNSVMMRWLFQDGSESDQAYARGVLEAIGEQKLQVLVPYVWVYESAFVVNYYAQRGPTSDNTYHEQLIWLFELSTVIRGEERPEVLYEFSQSYRVPAYDASYVMLALSQACPLATLDKTIIKARGKAKFDLFEPE